MLKARIQKKQLTDEEKEEIIRVALDTEEGRASLAASMVEPIRTSICYSGVGRKLLSVDGLPKGALARYARKRKDFEIIADMLRKRE